MTWNEPEFILVEEFGVKDANDLLTGGVLLEVKNELGIPNLNYQYGYWKELNETLKQWANAPSKAEIKYPLVFVEQPLTIVRGVQGYYGQVEPFRVFIIQESDKNYKATKRMSDVFKPKIYPIYRSLLKQIDLSPTFQTQGVANIGHRFTDRYFFGEDDLSVLNDVIDCSIVQFTNLKINNNPNCVSAGMSWGT